LVEYIMQKLLTALALATVLVASGGTARAQAPNTGTLRVAVKDATDLGLPHAVVVLTDAAGASREAPVDAEGVATFTGLGPGVYQVLARADGFREMALAVTVRPGTNNASVTLPVAISEEVTVAEEAADTRRDNGFTQALSADEIDALSDDPDEMAEQLAQMAGPGAQIFVDGFQGGRLPPKDQIQSIRFNSNSFSAEYHEAGMVRVEVITKPGMGGWRGRMNLGFRDESLNARNAFSAVKEPTEQQRFNFSFQGPIARGRTGLSISVDGNNAFDSRTILAQAPGGGLTTGLARNTTDSVNANVRVDHALGQNGQVRLEYQRRGTDRGNLGVGDFDLPERSFDTETVNDTFRIRNTRVLGRKVFSELRFEYGSRETTTLPRSSDPTIRVNDAFTAGGAGQSGTRASREIELTQSFDFTIGRRHSLRAGLRLDAGWWDSTQQQNTNGTYVFTSYDNYLLGRPATYTIRVGDPRVAYSQVKTGWFLQDDFRIGRTLSVSLGVRQEAQTQVDDRFNIAPRGAFTWNATRRTTVRGGYGIFYDWYDSDVHEQTVRVDGVRQQDLIVQDPGFPADTGGGVSLPASVIRAASLDQPMIQQASLGLERQITPTVGLRMDYMMSRGTNTLRAVNVNAPVNGVRPDPTFGNITEIQSTGRSASDRLTVGLNARHERLRLFGNVMYQLQSARNFSDSATALPFESTSPDLDWGPSAQDIRHRLFVMLNAPIWRGIRAGFNMQMASAPPFYLTTGRDDNGDTVFNDRPAGVTRNSGRGAGTINASLRLNKSFGFGGPAGGGAPLVPPPPDQGAAGGALNQRGPGGGGPGMVVMEASNARYRFDVYAQVSNLFNNVNYGTFVGNQLSPFFGRATSAQPARRMEVGLTLGF
jgi:hypothetical protein